MASRVTKMTCDNLNNHRSAGWLSLTACAGIFFSGESPFFQTNIAFFWTVKSWFIIYVFVLCKLFYTHNRSKDTGHLNAKSSLSIFSVPALWNSSPTAHHNDAILHSPMKLNHTLWFLIFVKSTGGSVAVYVVDS